MPGSLTLQELWDTEGATLGPLNSSHGHIGQYRASGVVAITY